MPNYSFNNPKFVICQWFPMGTNNLIALNRHLGAHKQYKSPTAFGMKGEIKDLSDGVFTMEDSGCFLQPIDFTFSDYLKAVQKESLDSKRLKGIEIDKDGACYVGLEFNGSLNIAQSKSIIGKSASEFTSTFLPVLTETQSSLLKCSYGITSDEQLLESMSSYSLVITDDIGVDIGSPENFLTNSETKDILTPVTDWILDHFTMNGCTVFIGMKAMVCVGNPDHQLRNLLKTLLFQYAMFNISLKLHSTLWGSMKGLKNMGNNIPKSNYKMLKEFNNSLALAQNDFSKQKIVCKQVKNSLESKLNSFINEAHKEFPCYEAIIKAYREELDKADDREMLSEQMSIDIQGLRDQLHQRMSLIMTKNGQRLNLILLVLTVISVIGIGEVLGFTSVQLILVVMVLTPFIYFVIRSFIQYRKDFE